METIASLLGKVSALIAPTSSLTLVSGRDALAGLTDLRGIIDLL